MVNIRPAALGDLKSITEIYNEAVRNTVATFDTEEKSIDEQKNWFENHGPKNPIIVAEKNNQIVGWAALSQYSNKCAYSDTAEISVYVKEEHQVKGIGKKLLQSIVKEGKKSGLHAAIARITEDNDVSIHLHESVGFKHIGVLEEVGFKFGKRLDVYLMQIVF